MSEHLKKFLVIDAQLGARPMGDYLADRRRLNSQIYAPSGRIADNSAPPALPRVSEATLEVGKLYPSAADPSVSYYLPDYRLDTDVEEHAVLTWRGDEDDDAPVAELRVRLCWDIPEGSSSIHLQLPTEHKATLWLTFARPVEDGSPVPSEIELGPLQPIDSFRQRVCIHDVYDREQFHLIYLAMTQTKWEAHLQIRTEAPVIMQTWQQVVVGRVDLATQLEAMTERRLMFTDAIRRRIATDAASRRPTRVDVTSHDVSLHPDTIRRAFRGATGTGDESPRGRDALSALRGLGVLKPTTTSAATARRGLSPDALAGLARLTRPSVAVAPISISRPDIPSRGGTASGAATGVLFGTGTSGGDGGSLDTTDIRDFLSRTPRAGITSNQIPLAARSIRLPQGWQADLYTGDAFSGTLEKTGQTLSELPDGFGASGATSLVLAADTPTAGRVRVAASTVTVFSHPSFSGNKQLLTVGSYDTVNLRLGDNQISSMTVPDGLRVILHDGRRFSGNSQAFTGSPRSLGAFDNKASAVTVEVFKAILYDRPAFLGRSQAFEPGDYEAAAISLGAARAQSIRLPKGWQAIFYSGPGCTGDVVGIGTSSRSLGDARGKIGSMRILEDFERPAGRSTSGVTVYSEQDHKGSHATLGPGAYDRTQLGIRDNTMRSVKVPPGWRVTLFDGTGFSGTGATFDADATELGALERRVSSMIIEVAAALVYDNADFEGQYKVVPLGRHDRDALTALPTFRSDGSAAAAAPSTPRLSPALFDYVPHHFDFTKARDRSDLFLGNRSAVPGRYVSTPQGEPAIAQVMTRNVIDADAFAFIADSDHFVDIPSEFGLTGDTLSELQVFDEDNQTILATVYKDTLLGHYYYTPNTFRLPRQDNAPYLPDVGVLLHEVFTGEDADETTALQHPRVTLVYRLVPTLSEKALEALAKLEGTQSIPVLRPIQPKKCTLTLFDMPADGDDPDLSSWARPDVEVDLTSGMSDALDLSYQQFEHIWSRELNPGQQLLRGIVRLELHDGSFHDVPVEGSLRSTVGTAMDRTFLGPIEGQPGHYLVAVRNRLESPIRLTAMRASQLDGGVIATIVGAVPASLAPSERVDLVYEVSDHDAVVVDIIPDADVTIEPDYTQLLPLLMGDTGYDSDRFEIMVTIDQMWFEFSTGEVLSAVRVEFDGDLSIELSADEPHRVLALRRSTAATLLGEASSDTYRYRVVNLHPSGAGARSEWMESVGDLEVFPASGDIEGG